MGRGTLTILSSIITCLILPCTAAGEDFKHVGDYLLKSHFKLTGDKITPIPTKSIAFRVFTDGVKVRVVAEGDEESRSTFEIYRSDGIGRQRVKGGALEVIPGLQATSNSGGVIRHLRMTRESMTITTFPAVSDQTIVSHSIAATPKTAPVAAKEPASEKPARSEDNPSIAKP
jgi:hypothetical protein